MNTVSRTLIAIVALAGISMGQAFAQSQPSVSTPVTSLHYMPTGVKDATGKELLVSPAYGDLTKGPHGSFVRMPAGFSSIPHIHTGDYWAVVISGVAVNNKVGEKEVPLPVGSYWLQKGGEKHITKCISPNECVFFLSQSGPFDYLLDKDGK